MSAHQSTLGTCPFCHSTIPPDHVLIEYETHGKPAMYAECPSCNDVVHPH